MSSRWLVLEGGPGQYPALYVNKPDSPHPERYYHQGISTYRVFDPEDITILKEYDPNQFQGDDQIIIQFYREFHRQKPVEPSYSAGWISPEGKWYPCEYGEHGHLARAIGAEWYNTLASEQFLHQRGWLQVDESGLIFYQVQFSHLWTQAQIDTIFDLINLPNTPTHWRVNMQNALKVISNGTKTSTDIRHGLVGRGDHY